MKYADGALKTTIKTAAVLVFLVFLGWGCNWFKPAALRVPEMLPAGPRPADLDNVTPADASKRINLVQGSQVMLRQTYLGQSAKQEDEKAAGSMENVRIVTIERFAPENVASLSWKLNQRVETDASKKAREEYLQTKPSARPEKEPEAVTEIMTVVGGISDLNLKDGHGLYLPAYWPTEKAYSQDTSGIWLSRVVYEELTKTHVSTVYANLFDQGFSARIGQSLEFSQALAAVAAEKNKIENKIDPDLMTAETEFSDWTLKINGKDVNVQVLKAKNWYGEIVVLNNPQNPLILKFNLDPAVSNPFLQTLMGYEITELSGIE